MFTRSAPRWLAAIAVLSVAAPLAAQQPSQAQIQAALQLPGAADSIAARIRQSGLTPDQIRARLRASGRDSTLLDAFLPDPATTTRPGTVTDSQAVALKALGLAPALPTAPVSLPVDSGTRRTPEQPHSDVFGVDVFRRSTTQFLPLLSGPVPADYRLGAGDVLVLILTGDVELTHQLSVSREGFVLIPQVGQVYLANLTLDQVRDVLYDRLGRVYSGVRRGSGATTRFDISVANVRAVQVSVVGEVIQPGAYQVSALGTVLTALYAAGGITERANPRAVIVRRNGAAVALFDLYDYLLRGDTRNDERLENGDVIYVGVRERRVTVRGSVVRPASYDVAVNETLADVVSAAGGLTADAARTRISIERIVPPAERRTGTAPRVTIDIPLPDGAIPPAAVQDGDTIEVFGIGTGERNYVEIAGSVYLPGKFGLEPGLTLSQLVRRAGGLKPATYDGRAHISRLDPVNQTRRMIAVTLPADSAGPWPADPALEDRDSVVIYSRLDMRPARTVSIVGAVNVPGTLPWRDGMTLRDLVLQAHGLVPGASLDSAEIARLPADRSDGQLATTIRVPLDSTYLFDRDRAGRYVGPPGTAFRRAGAPEVPLAPWDNVLIFRQPDFTYQRTVTVSGEVRFPGTYSLRNKADRLTDLIARAGGLTDRAYAAGIRFVRDSDGVGQLDVDLPRALRLPTSPQNIALRPGDRIFIPEYQPSVRIDGAVNSPGSVLWEAGKDLDYYLGAAGGVSQNGDRGRTSVRRANGTTETQRGGFLFFAGHSPTPTPGSVVTVPAKPDRPPRDNTAFLATIVTLLASTATVIVALIKL